MFLLKIVRKCIKFVENSRFALLIQPNMVITYMVITWEIINQFDSNKE